MIKLPVLVIALGALLFGGVIKAGSVASLQAVRKLCIDKMPNDLDQYIRAELFKQMPGRFEVVTDRAQADAVMTGISDEKDSTASRITGRYLGLHDTATGSISIVSSDGARILWSSEAGDRNMWVGALARGGQRKVAGRLVHNRKGAMAP